MSLGRPLRQGKTGPELSDDDRFAWRAKTYLVLAAIALGLALGAAALIRHGVL